MSGCLKKSLTVFLHNAKTQRVAFRDCGQCTKRYVVLYRRRLDTDKLSTSHVAVEIARELPEQQTASRRTAQPSAMNKRQKVRS